MLDLFQSKAFAKQLIKSNVAEMEKKFVLGSKTL